MGGFRVGEAANPGPSSSAQFEQQGGQEPLARFGIESLNVTALRPHLLDLAQVVGGGEHSADVILIQEHSAECSKHEMMRKAAAARGCKLLIGPTDP
eukprot:13339592-Alexandrium_andersonii.AAC.1